MTTSRGKKWQTYQLDNKIAMFHDNSICIIRYVNALRTKSTVYKEKRAELSELRAESGVLARTCEVSNQPFENASQVIVANNRFKHLLG